MYHQYIYTFRLLFFQWQTKAISLTFHLRKEQAENRLQPGQLIHRQFVFLDVTLIDKEQSIYYSVVIGVSFISELFLKNIKYIKS